MFISLLRSLIFMFRFVEKKKNKIAILGSNSDKCLQLDRFGLKAYVMSIRLYTLVLAALIIVVEDATFPSYLSSFSSDRIVV